MTALEISFFAVILKEVRRIPRAGSAGESFEFEIHNNRRLIMPEFCSSLTSSKKAGEKLSKKEIIRAIRFMVAAEYEAVGLYTQLADSVDCEKVKAVLTDIADEERVHAGEFLRLLYELDPKEKEFYKEGAGEVEELLEKLPGKGKD